MSGVRTTRSTVRFMAPFRISAVDEMLPAGNYEIDTDEQIVEGLERTAYVRVATLLHVQTTGRLQIFTIDPRELQALLACDRNPHHRQMSVHGAS